MESLRDRVIARLREFVGIAALDALSDMESSQTNWQLAAKWHLEAWRINIWRRALEVYRESELASLKALTPLKAVYPETDETSISSNAG